MSGAGPDGAARDGRLFLRVDFDGAGVLGPGKVRLMEAIAETGSITAAGRRLGMSYRRAWLLIDALNHLFRAPLVEAQRGGEKGGGATLTPLGGQVLARYRALEQATLAAARPHLDALAADLAPVEGEDRTP
ncbi:winged helix-turn-helix domain-containing protein [Segnochrobactraceae bacterium EtOH-i3]